MTFSPKKKEKKGDEGKLTWHTDLNKAHEISQNTGKPIFAFFTGSDWCGWCHKLQREVFAKQAFINWAGDNVVLLELDFPRRTPQDPAIRKQNQGLQQGFGVRGYPTIWIFNTNMNETTKVLNITPLGSLGYPRGAQQGKEEVLFLKNANAILENGK